MTNRLKEIRVQNGMTLAALAKASGYGISTINNFENGRTAASDAFMERVASILGVQPVEIAPAAAPKAAFSPRVTFPRIVWRQVPIVAWARAGAAHDYADLANQIEETVETDNRDPNAFALIIEGESMEPDFRAGDLVIVSPNSEPRNGDFVVARQKEGHGVSFKRFRRTGREGQNITLESLNPIYKTIEYPAAAFRFIYPAVDLKRKLRK